MLRWILLAVAVIVLAAGSTLVMNSAPAPSPFGEPVAPTATGPQPKAVIDGDLTWEFGELGQQQTGVRSWKLTNKGDADLEVWKGSSTCMCTVAKLQKDGDRLTLKPGESTDINIEFKTNYVIGDFHKGANIETNDPEHPTFPLFVHGKINPPIVVIPDQTIDLNTLSSDEGKKVFVGIFSPDRPETKITEVNTSKPEFLATEVVPMSEAEIASSGGKVKQGYKVNINVKPGFPMGLMREEIVIHTDHPHRPEIKLAVVGSVVGPVNIAPDRLRMITVKSAEGASALISLAVRGGKEATFTVAAKPENLEVSITPDDSRPGVKGRYQMKISIPKGTPSGLIDGDIVLKSDVPSAEELRIPVSFLVGSN